MIDPAYCKGCDYWRTVGWKSPNSSSRNRACHYLIDVGTPSRTRLGQLEVCNVRSVGGQIRPRAMTHKYDAHRRPKAGERYMELYKQGLTDRQIAEKAGSTINAVANWRQRKKLPPNKAVKPVYIPEEKTGDPCQRCYSAEVCKRVGGTCNEKERWKDD